MAYHEVHTTPHLTPYVHLTFSLRKIVKSTSAPVVVDAVVLTATRTRATTEACLILAETFSESRGSLTHNRRSFILVLNMFFYRMP